MPLDRRYFMEQLRARLAQDAALAKRAELDARDAARTAATASEKREDGRVALEFGSLATGHGSRARRGQEELHALDAFMQRGAATFAPKTRVELGAIVDVAAEDDQGTYERTFIILPVGAGTEVSGPGGDGFLVVVTPGSPVGRALMGKRPGEVADVTLRGEPYEWEILDVA